MNEVYVTISGNVVGDPQVRETRGQVPFVTFRLASNVRRLDAKTGEFVDVATNYVSVTAFRSLGVNLANSIKKGDPLVVYGRMRVNQWVNGERQGTTVEIDAYNAGFDLARGEATFERVNRPQLRTQDRLGDPSVQETRELVEGQPGDRDDEPAPDGLDGGSGDEREPSHGFGVPQPATA